MSAPLLELKNISKRFEKKLDVAGRLAKSMGANLCDETVHAVDRVDLTISIKIFGKTAQREVCRRPKTGVQPKVPSDDIEVAVAVEVGGLEAVPKAGRVFKAHFFCEIHPFPARKFKDHDRHPFPANDHFVACLGIKVGKLDVRDHPYF